MGLSDRHKAEQAVVFSNAFRCCVIKFHIVITFAPFSYDTEIGGKLKAFTVMYFLTNKSGSQKRAFDVAL